MHVATAAWCVSNSMSTRWARTRSATSRHLSAKLPCSCSACAHHRQRSEPSHTREVFGEPSKQERRLAGAAPAPRARPAPRRRLPPPAPPPRRAPGRAARRPCRGGSRAPPSGPCACTRPLRLRVAHAPKGPPNSPASLRPVAPASTCCDASLHLGNSALALGIREGQSGRGNPRASCARVGPHARCARCAPPALTCPHLKRAPRKSESPWPAPAPPRSAA